MSEKKARIEMIAGVEGDSIYINDYRICGCKPWGGGQVTKTWFAKPSDIIQALKGGK